MVFGKAIKTARKAAGMTQGELAQKIGCTTNTVCDWEREKYPPTNANNISALEMALEFESGELYSMIYGNPMQPARS